MLKILAFTIMLVLELTQGKYNYEDRSLFRKGLAVGSLVDRAEDVLAERNPILARKIAPLKAGYKIARALEDVKEDTIPQYGLYGRYGYNKMYGNGVYGRRIYNGMYGNGIYGKHLYNGGIYGHNLNCLYGRKYGLGLYNGHNFRPGAVFGCRRYPGRYPRTYPLYQSYKHGSYRCPYSFPYQQLRYPQFPYGRRYGQLYKPFYGMHYGQSYRPFYNNHYGQSYRPFYGNHYGMLHKPLYGRPHLNGVFGNGYGMHAGSHYYKPLYFNNLYGNRYSDLYRYLKRPLIGGLHQQSYWPHSGGIHHRYYTIPFYNRRSRPYRTCTVFCTKPYSPFRRQYFQ